MLNGFMRQLKKQIELWLDEDMGSGDVTTLSTVPRDHRSKGIIHAKQPGILCGVEAARAVFEAVDPSLAFDMRRQDGDVLQAGDIIAEIEGSSHSILAGERLALNLLQRMSGIATETSKYMDVIKHTSVRLVDTRKTTPGHRMLEKYAVQVGGGHNHRYGLYDAVMIKDNHIKASGGIPQAVASARAFIPHTMKIEVEVENFDQLTQALEAGADIIMLDNMEPAAMTEAMRRIKERSPHVVVEASGGIHLGSLKAVAETGVDVISVGRLTNAVSPLDISLDLGEKKGR
ncbi:carboxylating nicotinate-nucleotide diphosphorylase [Marinicrinis lubricantis]|uniref:nicotinate-nucleotide diphosphorylase (carboxylating) n=1 Tax=Marinicrinis lubricantis TaxID=2086470 RepID=A0ABW1IPW2_9BACL